MNSYVRLPVVAVLKIVGEKVCRAVQLMCWFREQCKYSTYSVSFGVSIPDCFETLVIRMNDKLIHHALLSL